MKKENNLNVKNKRNNFIKVNYKKAGVVILFFILLYFLFYFAFSEEGIIRLIDKEKFRIKETPEEIIHEQQVLEEEKESKDEFLDKVSKKDLTGEVLSVDQEKGFGSERVELLAGVIFSDDFNRVDGSLGPDWFVVLGGDLSIRSQAVSTDLSGDSFGIWNQAPPSANYYAQARVLSPVRPDASFSGPVIRYVDENNHYELRSYTLTGGAGLFRVKNGIWTSLKDYFAPEFTSINFPAIFRLSMNGDQITVIINDALGNVIQDTYVDPDPILLVGSAGFVTSVGPGLVGEHELILDDWELGTVGSVCGDGYIDPGEVCDDGANNGQLGFCNRDCSGQTTSFCDDFNRIDSNDLGSDWLEVIDNFEIFNNELAMLFGFQDSLALVNRNDYIFLYNSAQSVFCYDIFTDFVTNPDTCGLIARYVDQNNYYYVTYTRPGGVVSLKKKVSGVVMDIATVNGLWDAAGSKELALTIDGSNINVFFDGTNIISTSDVDLQSSNSRVGVYGYGTDSFANRVVLDNYKVLSQPTLPIVCNVCGNGIIEGSEVCDDGMHCEDGTSCTSDSQCTGIGDGLCITRNNLGGCNAECSGLVECLSDNDCNDNDLCTGVETCDLATWTCMPGTPVDCSYLDDQCNIGICNPLDGLCYADPIVFSFSDDFNRDGALGSDWLLYSGLWDINNNKAHTNIGGSVAVWNVQPLSADYWVQGTLSGGGALNWRSGIGGRILDENNGYYVFGEEGQGLVQLRKQVGGGVTQLASWTGVTFPVTVRLSMAGNSFVVTINGEEKAPILDSSFSLPGYVGLWSVGGFMSEGFVDDWSAGGFLVSCDDGFSCTTNDQCDPFGGCVGVPDDGLCSLDTICGDWSCNPNGAGADPVSGCEVIYASSTTECRSSTGLCDVAEFCTGSSDQCPVDQLELAGIECRTSVDICDLAEVCDGVSASCPADSFEPVTTECRSSLGVCDLTEFCTGSSAACPLDVKSTDLCRASTGQCDIEEFCDGLGNDCPADLNQPDGTSCDDNLYCNVGETCQSGACTGGISRDCSDVVSCTVDSCNEITDSCVNNPSNLLCDDGIACTNDICDQFLGCSNPEIDVDLDTYSICTGPNQDCNDNDPLINPGTIELCTDDIDNNCNNECDYDTSLPCTLHGDVVCPVGVTGISASNTNPFENTNIEVRCTADIADVNSIQAFIETTSCIFDRWELNEAVFICNVGLPGVKTLRCTVDTSKSYQTPPDQIQQITVLSSDCSTYTTDVDCLAVSSICEWCVQCQGTLSSGTIDSCVNIGNCGNYICRAGECGAVCDASIGCASTDCDSLDGCVGNDYYDYSDVANSCLSDCVCEANTCGAPAITFDDPFCLSLTTSTTTTSTTSTTSTTTTTTTSSTTSTTSSTTTTSTTFSVLSCNNDGTKQDNEECDGDELGGVTCNDYGFNSGSLTCTEQCEIDSSGCYNTQPPSGGGGSGGGTRFSGIRYACNDAEDNDGDGYCDLKDSTCIDGSIPGDPGCQSIFDDNETNFIPPPYLQPPEMCVDCWGKKDLRGLGIVNEFFDYQDYFTNIYVGEDLKCCECNYNNIQDLGEEGVDCGGSCPSCETNKFVWPKCEISIWLVAISLFLIALQLYFRKLNRLSAVLAGGYSIVVVSLMNNINLSCNIINLVGVSVILQEIYFLLKILVKHIFSKGTRI